MYMKAAAHIAVKVLAIFAFIKFITYLQSIYSFSVMVSTSPSEMSASTQMVLLVFPIVLLLVVSLCLWLYAEEISDRMVRNLQVTEKVNLDYEALQSIAFSVAGIVIIADALPMLFSTIIRSQLNDYRQMEQLIGIGSQGLKLFIGIWLFLGSRGIVGLLRSLRTAGVKNI